MIGQHGQETGTFRITPDHGGPMQLPGVMDPRAGTIPAGPKDATQPLRPEHEPDDGEAEDDAPEPAAGAQVTAKVLTKPERKPPATGARARAK